MAALSEKQLRQRGVPDDDIRLAKEIQAQQRRRGDPVLSLGQICGITPPRNVSKADPAIDLDELTKKAVRGARSHAELMAIYARLTALQADSSPNRDEIRECASKLETLAGGVQLEFEFSIWRGNSVTAHDYLDQMIFRLLQLQEEGYKWDPRRTMTDANRILCMAVLQLVGRHLEWQGPRSQITASEIAKTLNIDKMQVSRALKALEEIGAIMTGPAPTNRSKKIIVVTPEGIYRGRMSKDRKEHSAAVEDFEKEKARIQAIKNEEAATQKPTAKRKTSKASQLLLFAGE